MNAMKKHEVDYSQHTIYLIKSYLFSQIIMISEKNRIKKEINGIVT